MNIVPLMWILWAGLTTALLIVLLYRNSLTRNERDDLFLESTAETQHHDQEVLLDKVHRVQPVVRLTAVSTGLVTAFIAGFYLWDMVKRMM